MPCKSQEDTEAEYLKRMLTAQDQWSQPGRFQPWPIPGQEAHGDRRQRQEMGEAQHVQIGLVDRIHPLLDDTGQTPELRHRPGQGDAERGKQVGEANPHRHRRRQQPRQPLSPAHRAPGPEHEQQLPGQRVEEPDAIRISGQGPVEMPGQHIDQRRQRQRDVGLPLHQPQDQRQEQHQHDIERQHIHVDGAKSQQQRLDDGHVRLLEKIHDAHLFAVERVLETGGDVGNLGQEDREQEHMRDIDLPDPPQDPRGRDHDADLQHRAAIDERRGVAGDEDEDLGGVGKSVIADREPGQDVRRQMIDEDQPEREPAKQIEPQLAFANGREHDRRRGRCSRGVAGRGRGFGICLGSITRRTGNGIGNGRHLTPSGQFGITRWH